MLTIRAQIEQSDLFDRDYYLSCYGEDIGDGGDALGHYLESGQDRGFKPNAEFDPLVYRLRYPEATLNPLLHYLEHRPVNSDRKVDFSVMSAFPQIGPPDWTVLNVDPGLAARDLQNDLDHSRRFSDAQTIAFTVDGRQYQLLTPSAETFFARLRDDQPFAYPRLPHGFWDCLLELRTMRARLAEAAPPGLFSAEQLDRLTRRLCDEMMPALGVYAENFLPEILDGIAGESTQPAYQRSISFKWRPTIDDRVFSRTDAIGEVEQRQLKIFTECFKQDPVVYESMIWKRWAYSGDLKRLPPLARERPVILVGAAWVGHLDQRWQLPWFEHVEIPLNSYTIRYAVLDRIKAAVLRAKAVAELHATKRPLVLLQGGSFAYWLIARLHCWDPSVFYFDLGQSLHIWFLDDENLWWDWLYFHPRLLMENCELDAFYRERGIALKPPFSTSLAAAEDRLPVIDQTRPELLATQESLIRQIAKLQEICAERLQLIDQLQNVCAERLELIERLQASLLRLGTGTSSSPYPAGSIPSARK